MSQRIKHADTMHLGCPGHLMTGMNHRDVKVIIRAHAVFVARSPGPQSRYFLLGSNLCPHFVDFALTTPVYPVI